MTEFPVNNPKEALLLAHERATELAKWAEALAESGHEKDSLYPFRASAHLEEWVASHVSKKETQVVGYLSAAHMFLNGELPKEALRVIDKAIGIAKGLKKSEELIEALNEMRGVAEEAGFYLSMAAKLGKKKGE